MKIKSKVRVKGTFNGFAKFNIETSTNKNGDFVDQLFGLKLRYRTYSLKKRLTILF